MFYLAFLLVLFILSFSLYNRTFLNKEVSVPRHPEDFLTELYGEWHKVQGFSVSLFLFLLLFFFLTRCYLANFLSLLTPQVDYTYFSYDFVGVRRRPVDEAWFDKYGKSN